MEHGLGAIPASATLYRCTLVENVVQGLDCFSSKPDMGGKVISGKFKMTHHLSDHYLGSPYPTTDLESWRVLSSSRDWNVQAPGFVTVIHVAGSEMGTGTVVEQVAGPFDLTDYVSDLRTETSTRG